MSETLTSNGVRVKRLEKTTQNVMKYLEQYWWLAPVLGLVFAAVIVFAIGTAQSLWFDESYSVTIAKSSVAQLINLTAVDVHPPLYYLILKAWGTLFGWSDIALRALGMVIAAGLVWSAALLVKRMFGIRAMIVTIPFISIAPFLLRYDFELRMYALAAIIGIVATHVLIRATQSKTPQKKWWIIYGLLIAVGMYTVYYVALLWIAHVVWLVYKTRKSKQPIIRQPWFLAIIGSIIVFLPWMPVFISQLTNGALAGITQATTIDNLVGIVSFAFLYKPVWQLNAFETLVIVAVLVAVAWCIVAVRRFASKVQKEHLLLLMLQLSVPLGIITIISFIKPFYVERYFLPMLPALYIAIGVMLSITAKRNYRKSLTIGLFLFTVLVAGTIHLAMVGNFNFQRLQTPRSASIRSAVTCDNTSLVVAEDPYAYIDSLYYFDGCNMGFYAKDNVDYVGGYAPLHNSPGRIASPAEVQAKNLYVLHWLGSSAFVPTAKYELKSSMTFDKQVVDHYQLLP